MEYYESECVPRRQNYRRVLMWQGRDTAPTNAAVFEKDMLERFGVRVQYLEEVVTRHAYPLGEPVLGCGHHPGGRNDLLFAVHTADEDKLTPLFAANPIDWLEDAIIKQGWRHDWNYDWYLIWPDHWVGYCDPMHPSNDIAGRPW